MASQYQPFLRQEGPFGQLPAAQMDDSLQYVSLPPEQAAAIQYDALPSKPKTSPFLRGTPMPVYSHCKTPQIVWILFFIFSLVVFGTSLASQIVHITSNQPSTANSLALSYMRAALMGISAFAAITTGILAFKKEKQKKE